MIECQDRKAVIFREKTIFKTKEEASVKAQRLKNVSLRLAKKKTIIRRCV